MAVQIINSSSSQFSERRMKKTISKVLKVLVIFVIIGLISLGIGYYLYNKRHQSILNEKPVFIIEASILVAEYDKSETVANKKFLGKVIEVRGVVSEKIKDKKGNISLTLQGPDLAGVGCEFEKAAIDDVAGIVEGQEVVIKGICTGVLMDVVLVDCVIANKK